jgi:hypothetical protein
MLEFKVGTGHPANAGQVAPSQQKKYLYFK